MNETPVRKTDDKNDLTTGPIIKKLILFFLPIAAGTLFQQLYNAVDAFVVSKYVGTDALAAVGGSPAILSNLIIGFCTSLAGGCAVVIAHFYGAKEQKAVASAVKTSFLFSAVLGLLIGAVVMWLSPTLLTLLKTPAETYEDALLYQKIYFSGSFFILVFNMGAGILRAVGNSRYPFVCLIVSCGLNIILDILFVTVFKMGVAGVAYATVIAEAVSTVMVVWYLLRTTEPYRLSLRGTSFTWSLLRRMMGIGIPSGLQSSMYGISNMILQVAVNSLGTTIVASWAMSGKIDGVYWAMTSAFGTAITTFIGQNYGAKNAARIRESRKKGLLLHLSMTGGIILFLLSCGRMLLHILTDDNGVIEGTWIVMLFIVPAYIFWSVIEIYSGVLRGIGDTVIPSVIIAVGICVSRVVWIYTMFRAYSTLEMICVTYPLSWFLTDIAILIYYHKREKRLEEELS